MSRRILILLVVILALGVPAVLLARSQQASEGSDSNPIGVPEISVPDRLQATAAVADNAATLYFTPQDENTSTTVLFLFNTGTVTQTARIETFRLSGATTIDTEVAVPAGELVRIVGDTVDTVSASWQETVLINFTTNSTYGRMTLPEGVKATGYVAWNGNGPYDPLAAVPVLDLRFSIDPPTIFLPVSTAD